MPLSDRYMYQLLTNNKHYYFSLLLAVILVLGFDIAVRAQTLVAQNNFTESISHSETVIYVDPQRGNDAQNGTSKQSALKTITKALELAQSGTTIQLGWGDYSEATGETFPLIVENNVTIKGTPGGKGYNTTIRGNGYFISPTGAGQNVTIAAVKEAKGIIGVTVVNPHNRGHGLWIESANPIVSNNTFTRNGNTGLSVNGNSSPVIENNYFYNNAGNGLLVYGTSSPEVINNVFENTGFGVSLVQNAAPMLTGNTFDGNRIGVILEGNSQATLRDNKITNSAESGLTAIANSRVDLGNSQQPGNNVFTSNSQSDIQNATDNEIVAVGTDAQGRILGRINFDSGEALATAPSPSLSSRLSLNPVDERTSVNRNLEPLPQQDAALPPTNSNVSSTNTTNINVPSPPKVSATDETSLPAPPPVSSANEDNQELVFNAPNSSQPVPYPPETDTKAPSSTPSSTTNNSPYTPSPLGGNNSSVGSLSDLLSSSTRAAKYKVLVEVDNDSEQSAVRSRYPEAFATIYNGKSVLQIGAFSYWDKAKQASRSLEDLGLNAYILE